MKMYWFSGFYQTGTCNSKVTKNKNTRALAPGTVVSESQGTVFIKMMTSLSAQMPVAVAIDASDCAFKNLK